MLYWTFVFLVVALNRGRLGLYRRSRRRRRDCEDILRVHSSLCSLCAFIGSAPHAPRQYLANSRRSQSSCLCRNGGTALWRFQTEILSPGFICSVRSPKPESRGFAVPSGGLLDHRRVTLARSLLQSFRIYDVYLATGVVDQTRLLQDGSSHRDTGTPRSQHVCKKLLG
jgi:hypothetical protein